MRNPIKILGSSPDYVFGRFRTVRGAYARIRRLWEQFPGVPSSVYLGEKYGQNSRPLSLTQSRVVVSDLDVATHVRNLSQSAYSTGLHLSPDASDSLLHAAKSRPLHGTSALSSMQFSELMESPALRESIAIATVSGCSELETVQAVAADPLILDVVASALGYRPTRVGSWLFWSIANKLSLPKREALFQTVRFHYDVHGFNFLYVNFYLLDTDRRTGAHVLIRGSHRRKKPRHLFGSANLDDERAVEDFGNDRIEVVEGRAGTGFFEDTSCYHKALPPLDRDRLMLQLRYQ